MGAKISASEFVLVVRGWEKRRLRVVLTTPVVSFGGFCNLFKVSEEFFSIIIAESNNTIGVSTMGCVFGFTDSPPDGELILGERVESGVVAVRENFNLTVMALL
jgi:hypothetical protein